VKGLLSGKLRIFVDVVLTASVLAGLYFYVRRFLPGAVEAIVRIPVPVLAGALCLVASGYLVRLFTWSRMASSLGLAAPTAATGRSYFLSYLGRYVPGNVGLLLVRLRAYGGVRPGTVTLATFLEYAAAMSAAFLLAGAGLAGWRGGEYGALRAASLPCLAAALLLILPKPAAWTLSRLLRLLGRPVRMPSLPSSGAMAGFSAGYVVSGLLHGAALFLLLSSMSPLPGSSYPFVTGAYYLAGVAGAILLFSPGGLGVREALLVAALPAVSGRADALAATLLMRAVTVLAELVLCGIFIAAAGKPQRNGAGDAQ
jgi:glycosyltransferase 2 family protein